MAAKKYQLPFGKGQIEFQPVSDNSRLLDKQVKPLYTQLETIEKSIDNPIEFIKLEEYIHNFKKIAIVVPDKTRKSGTHVYLPVILNRLKKLGNLLAPTSPK